MIECIVWCMLGCMTIFLFLFQKIEKKIRRYRDILWFKRYQRGYRSTPTGYADTYRAALMCDYRAKDWPISGRSRRI